MRTNMNRIVRAHKAWMRSRGIKFQDNEVRHMGGATIRFLRGLGSNGKPNK